MLVSAVEGVSVPVPEASEQEWAEVQPVQELDQEPDQESDQEWVLVCSAAEYLPHRAPRRSLDHSNSRPTTPRALAPRARDDCAHP